MNVFVFSVIRAKVVGRKEVVTGNDAYGYPIKMIRYDVKQIKVSGEYSCTNPNRNYKKYTITVIQLLTRDMLSCNINLIGKIHQHLYLFLYIQLKTH